MRILSRVLTIIMLLSATGLSIKAQTPPTQLNTMVTIPAISLTWNASPTVGIAGYNLYRAPCTGTISQAICSAEGAFVKINTAIIVTPSATDMGVVYGSGYSYYVTSICPTAGCDSVTIGESLPSAHAAITMSLPAIGITITPTIITTPMGITTQFGDTLTGSPNTTVTWSTTIGTISSTGLFVAPLLPGTGTITVTSTADPTKSAKASVTVVLPGISCIRNGTTSVCTITNTPAGPQRIIINPADSGVAATF